MPVERLTLIRLTRGEQLWLWRQRSGRTQRTQRRKLKLTEGAYRQLEQDAPGVCWPARLLHRLFAEFAIAPATPVEMARIMRRRKGWTLAHLAHKLGVTRQTLYHWERSGSPQLLHYWFGQEASDDERTILALP